jgi:hypothetical protein
VPTSSAEVALDEVPTMTRPTERLALRPEEAARALGVGRSFFFAEVLPELRTVRRGRVRLIPVRELEFWLERSAARLVERPAIGERVTAPPKHSHT